VHLSPAAVGDCAPSSGDAPCPRKKNAQQQGARVQRARRCPRLATADFVLHAAEESAISCAALSVQQLRYNVDSIEKNFKKKDAQCPYHVRNLQPREARERHHCSCFIHGVTSCRSTRNPKTKNRKCYEETNIYHKNGSTAG